MASQPQPLATPVVAPPSETPIEKKETLIEAPQLVKPEEKQTTQSSTTVEATQIPQNEKKEAPVETAQNVQTTPLQLKPKMSNASLEILRMQEEMFERLKSQSKAKQQQQPQKQITTIVTTTTATSTTPSTTIPTPPIVITPTTQEKDRQIQTKVEAAAARDPTIQAQKPPETQQQQQQMDFDAETLKEQERIFESLRIKHQQEEEDRQFAAKLAKDASIPSIPPPPPPTTTTTINSPETEHLIPSTSTTIGRNGLTKSAEAKLRRAGFDEMSGIGDLADLMRVMAESAAEQSEQERASIKDPALKTLSEMFPTADIILLKELLTESKGNIEAAAAILFNDQPQQKPIGAAKVPTTKPLSPELAKLAFIFPKADQTTLETALKECRGNIDEAVSWLLGDTMPIPISSPMLTDGEEGITDEMRRLSFMFPSASKQVLENALDSNENDIERAVAWLLGEPIPPKTPPYIEPESPPSEPDEPIEYPHPPIIRGRNKNMPNGFKVPPIPKISWNAPAQSLIRAPMNYSKEFARLVSTTSNPEWTSYCFHQMLLREQELNGEFFVFYHSYSLAALLYEVHGVLAQNLYSSAGNCPLPRILSAPFDHSPTIESLLSDFKKLTGQDHDPRFRALAISTSVSLRGEGTEAPPITCFEMGYSCSDLSFRGLLTGLLTTCGLSSSRAEKITNDLVRIGGKYGLPVSVYGSASAGGGGYHHPGMLSGHMLQLFVHKDFVDDVAYASAAYGVPTKEKLSKSLSSKASKAPSGQARVWMHPGLFTDISRTRLYHYAASPILSSGIKIDNGRDQMIAEIREALGPVLDTPEAFERTHRGILGTPHKKR